MSGQGEFFAVGRPQWQAACGLGLNPAIALLVMARGSGRDNATTSWSSNAVETYTGLAWTRGREAVRQLAEAGIVKVIQAGARPRYKIDVPESIEDLIWLPNELVTGAGKEPPPVRRLRQRRDADLVRLLVELYGEQELAGDGGLPRSLVHAVYSRERICGWGPFTVYGFERNNATAYNSGPLARYGKGKDSTVWEPLNELVSMGLLQRVRCVAESGEPDAELIVALSGDGLAERVSDAAYTLAERLPDGFREAAEAFEFTFPVPPDYPDGVMVDVYRLHYRPRTTRTATWYAKHASACESYLHTLAQLAEGIFKVSDIKVSQGGSR